MSEYEVRQGDCVSSVATRFGLRWQDVWEHPDNDELRSLREDPNMLCPGDVLALPDSSPKYEAVQTGSEHKLVLHNTLVSLRVKIQRNGEALGGDYVLEVQGRTIEGSLADGVLEEDVPSVARQARVVLLETNEELILELGCMAPADTPAGARERLRNLGLGSVSSSDTAPLDDHTRTLLRLVQRAEGLDVTGDLDDDTAQALATMYGC